MSKKQLKNRHLMIRGNKQGSTVWRRLGHFLLALTGVSSIVVLIVFSLYFGIQSVSNIVQRPVAEISVESDFNYIHRQDVMRLLNNTMYESFLYENLNTVKIGLEKNAWIDHVLLSRRWPDHLHVKIIEQVPIARWSDVGFINYRGELVVVDDVKQLDYLPHLAGPAEDSVEVLKQYQAISKLLRKYDLEITSLIKSQHHRWMIELANGWQINIGKEQLMEKMQRFAMVLKNQLLAYKDSIAVVDMRYQHGVAVKWLESEETTSALRGNKVSFMDGI